MSKKKNPDNYRDNLIKRSEDAKTVRKVVSIIIISLVLILVIGGISGYMYIKSALDPVEPDSDQEVEIEIPIGSSTSEIAGILEEKDIIKDSLIFRFYIKFNNVSNFQAGNYTFSPSMELEEIIESLKSGKVLKDPVYSITIPEGKTIDEIAGIYAERLPFTKDEFLNKVNDSGYMEVLINTYPSILTNDVLNPDIRTPLEGYLFAATYSFYKENPGIKTIVEHMLDKTKAVVTPFLDEISAHDFSVHEALTMTSLVENESSTEKQRKKIAGVFYNRLDKGMPLQTDPTVLYALGKHKDKVLYKDLEKESPYNTYYVDALPVGPISNFSKTSLEAVLNPEKSDYLYFLHDSNGKIHYAETNEKHLELKNKYIE